MDQARRFRLPPICTFHSYPRRPAAVPHTGVDPVIVGGGRLIQTLRYVAMCSTASIVAGQRCLTVIDMAKPPTLNPDSPVPLYVQAADYLTARITQR